MRRRTARGWATRSQPSTETVPEASGVRPAHTRKRVLLPAPLGPWSNTTSAAATSRSAPAKAGNPPSSATAERRWITAPLTTPSTVVAPLLTWPCRAGPVPFWTVDLRTFLRGTGKTLITAGALILLFVAFQLWGTGIAEARSQHALRKQLQAVDRPPATTSTTAAPLTSVPQTSVPPTTAPPLPPPPVGAALAIIRIPSIGVDVASIEGVGVDDLKKGPGHYPNSPLPGQPGNTAFAGHRTTYGAPFYHLNEVKPGDPIFVATRYGTFHYTVVMQHDVAPSDVSVIAPTKDNRLTLTTCTPRFSASKRLIVVAHLDGPATAPPTLPAPRPSNPAKPAGPLADAATVQVGSLSGQATSTVPALVWAGVCIAIWIGAFLLGRRWRRWPAYLIATPIFLLALFFFFENFSRFVPANI